MNACYRCGTSAATEARFCAACGAALGQVVETPAVRKHVIVFFVDIVGSTVLGERLDPEPLRRYLKRYFDTVSAVLWRHGGTVEKFIGDAVMAVFGVPVAREDDAARAVRAALELHDEVALLSAALEREYDQELRVRVGINGGEVFVARNTDGQFSVTGDTVNTAARLEQAAGPSQTLVGGTVAHLAGPTAPLVPVEPLTVKGKAAALPAWRVDVSAPLASPAGPRAALVGRDDDLADLHRTAERVVRRRDSCLVTVLGSAGIGKSRLVSEFAAGLDGWRVLEGSCPSYASGATFWPLALMLEQLGEDWPAQVSMLLSGDRDASLVGDRLATAVGASDDGTSLDDIVWAARRLVEALCGDRPVLLIFEDLHWAAPTFIDFVDRLSARLRSVPAMIVCLSRPELLEAYPMWGGGRSFATAMELEALTAESVRDLIDELTADVVAHGTDVLTWEPEVDRLTAVSEGNPLILQQLLQFGATGSDMPVSLKTLFEARLDRLDPADRLFCECAAVIGREFWADAVRFAAGFTALSDADWQSTLDRLERMDILQPTRARNGGRPGHRFTHTLLMESIYRATPKSQRSQSHSKVATWLASAHGLGAGERSELIAHHLERAHRLLSEISRQDPQGTVLAAAAGEAAVLASGHCMARSDLPAAVRLLGQAQRLLPPDDRRQYDVVRWLFDCLMSMGAMDEASSALDQTDAVLSGSVIWGLLGPVPRAALDLRRERIGRADAHEVARALIATVTGDTEPGALLWAHELEALAFSAGMEMAAAERSARIALGYARAAGDRRAESRLLCGLCEMAFWGLTPVAEARALCQSSLALSESDLRLTAPVLAMLAALHAMEGDHVTAGELLRRSYEITVDLQLPGLWVGLRQYSCLVELFKGDHERATEECLAAVHEIPETDPAVAPFRLMAARAQLAAGHRDRAAELFGWDGGAGPTPRDEDEPHYQGLWFGLAAQLAAAAGDRDRALAWARRAVDITGAMESPRSHADALIDLAIVHRTLGDEPASRASIESARAQYLLKGAIGLASTVDKMVRGAEDAA